MELYNPPNIDLPALKIEKIRERKAIEKDPTVSNFICSNLLLDIEFNKLYLDLLRKSRELLMLIRSSISEDFLYDLALAVKMYGSRKLKDIALAYLGKKYLEDQNRPLDKAVCKKLEGDFVRYVSLLSKQIQNSLSVFEKKKRKKLSILSLTVVNVCKNCGRVIFLGRFRQCTCFCGERISRVTKVKQIPVHHFNDNLINFLNNNYWLEHGADYLLRRKNLKTLVGYSVLGHSGVSHEIDNIADSKRQNFRFFCECKNSEVKVSDIFIFSGKMTDVGCTRGYIFTTAERVTDEIVRLARSKNIDIIKGVLKKETTTLLEDIKEV